MDYYAIPLDDSLEHYGIKGQKWGLRRYQEEDGSYTPEGLARYGQDKKAQKEEFKAAKKVNKDLDSYNRTNRYQPLAVAFDTEVIKKQNERYTNAVNNAKRYQEAARSDPAYKKAEDSYRKAHDDIEKYTKNKEFIKNASATLAEELKKSINKDAKDYDKIVKEYDDAAKRCTSKDLKALMHEVYEFSGDGRKAVNIIESVDSNYKALREAEAKAINEYDNQKAAFVEKIASQYKNKMLNGETAKGYREYNYAEYVKGALKTAYNRDSDELAGTTRELIENKMRNESAKSIAKMQKYFMKRG